MVASNGPDMYPASAVGSGFMDFLTGQWPPHPDPIPPFRTEEDYNNMKNPMSMPGNPAAAKVEEILSREAFLEYKVKKAEEKLARKQLKAKRKKGRH